MAEGALDGYVEDGETAVLVAPEDLKTGDIMLPTPAWDERG